MKKKTRLDRFPLVFFICATAVWASIAVSSIFGCGKKAPPLPPRSNPVPPVTDLSHELQDARVFLTWSIPDDVKRGAFGEGKSVLFRAETGLTDEPCPDCPLSFLRIAELPILHGESVPAPSYAEEVRRGFRYTYKVVLYMDNGVVGGPSNLIQFDYRERGK